MGKTVKPKKRPGAVGRPANAGSFSADAPRPGPGRGHKKPQDEFGFDPLADMLFVYRNKENVEQETEGQKAARKLLKTDYKTFMQMLLRAEGLQVKDAAAAATDVEMGKQEETVVELAERLLREWESESGV